MKHEPFSVAISVYMKDNSIYFNKALESIIVYQSVKPDEIVLVIDGPISEEIYKIIDNYRSKYNFKVIRLVQNSGLGNSLRVAINNCSYELIARMDSDDIAYPDRFEQQLNFMQSHPSVDIVGGDITEFVDEGSNIIAKRVVPQTNEAIHNYLIRRSPFNHVTVMFKKTSVLAAGNYQDLFWNEDYYLWVRMSLNNCIFANTGTNLVNVRVGRDMYNRRGGIKYFKSEKFLQDYMLKMKMICLQTYCINVCKRLIIQVLMPSLIRGWIFKKFARIKA